MSVSVNGQACWLRRLVRVTGWVCAGWMAVGAAHAMSAAELQRLLQSRPAQTVAFEEVRESPWLAVPVISRGTMHANGDRLEKRQLSPRQETWRLLPDRMEWVGPNGAVGKKILYSDVPAVAALANAMRHVVAGDLVGLERDFRLVLNGDERVWTVRLEPRTAEVARYIDHLELEGVGASLQVIIIAETRGERTTTRLQN